MHYFTIYGSLRPFGASALLAAYDEDTKSPELYLLEPSGAASRYLGHRHAVYSSFEPIANTLLCTLSLNPGIHK